jgi:DNA polymerase III sliding clamp (beta) subunit (PCNA family)
LDEVRAQMRFTTTAGALREALGTARAAIPASPVLVAHSGVLLLVKGTSLSVVGSDGETTIAALLEVTDGLGGQALLPPKPVSAFLATVDADASVSVDAEDQGDAEVRAQGAPPYRFRSIASTFPLPSASKVPMSPVRFERLGEAIAAVRAAAGKDEPRVQIVSKDDRLVLHTTDTYRIGQVELPEAGFGDFTGVASLPAFERMARHGIDKIGVDQQGRTLRGTGPGIVIMSRMLKSPFPAIESVLRDQRPAPLVEAPVEPVIAAIRRLEAVADTAPLKVRIEGSQLLLSVSNVDLGSGEECVRLSKAIDVPVEFRVNLAYLRDAVDAHVADTFELGFGGELQPVFLTSKGPLPVTTVVMPIQV